MIQVQWCSSSAAESTTEIKDMEVDEMENFNFSTNHQTGIPLHSYYYLSILELHCGLHIKY
ncbi:hypothetical protein P3S68_001182 [Capsicum galapagoense]